MPEGVWSGKEQMKPIYRCILLSGIAVWGILMTISVPYTELRFLPGDFMDVIDTPAEILFKLWGSSGLPPYGEAGFAMIPVMVGLQWLIVFVVVFFMTRRKRKDKGTSDKVKD